MARSGSSAYTYTWEQQNSQISYQPPLPTAFEGPNFRSIPPTRDPTRFHPSLKSLANNGSFTWEVLSWVDRIMDFRVTVRSNRANGSCNAYGLMSVTVNAASGPFKLTYPSENPVVWQGNTQQTIKWDVANTNKNPIHETKVNVVLSTDGGKTYTINLAQNVPNNGVCIVKVPLVNTNQARIMVRASSGNFFTISRKDFKITR